MKASKGFSLIEVLVFISILSIFFVVAIAVVTASLRNMKVDEHKILAVRSAEELLEWVTSEKETDWSTFTGYVGTYCLNDNLGVDWLTTFTYTKNKSGSCTSGEFDGIGSTSPLIYKRQLSLTGIGSSPYNRIDANVVVSWQEPNKTYSISLDKTFSVWE